MYKNRKGIKMIRRIKNKLFGSDERAEQCFHLGKGEIYEALRKDSIKNRGYPMNRVWVGVEWINEAWYDIKLSKAFLRIYVNNAPLRVIEWDEKEKSYYPRFREYGGEIYIFRGRDYTFPKFEEGYLEIFVNIPPYIDIDEEVHIGIRGCLTLSSGFGHFDKTVNYDLEIEPENWR